ncbi:MAG TPA: cell filamentation protein Fic [Candidatus Pacebacteria bacterium]|nr:cell filamentation protein Fic [Candidatus Paceibacterota bacterium]
MNETQVNQRQLELLNYLLFNPFSSRAEITEALGGRNGSRITAIRDLNHLLNIGLIEQAGGGKHVKYNLKAGQELLIPVDLDGYFIKNTDSREISHPNFNLKLINNLTGLFSEADLNLFEQGRAKLKDKFENLDKTLLKRELERFTIELSWKSSQIEGNTYSLLETEELIKNKKEADGHDKKEAIMILNHKNAFNIILNQSSSFKEISLIDLRSIHAELTKNLEITSGIRESGVGITGTKYLPPDNKWQIEAALTQLINDIKKNRPVPEKALILLAMISYLQPFTDGNKRTSRMVSNAILLANGYFPLSYRSVDEVEYKKALILFYEQNNLFHLKRIFLEQQQFAITNYFL